MIGAGVNDPFRMGHGTGLRISEPVHRRLPTEQHAGWRKDDATATYEPR